MPASPDKAQYARALLSTFHRHANDEKRHIKQCAKNLGIDETKLRKSFELLAAADLKTASSVMERELQKLAETCPELQAAIEEGRNREHAEVTIKTEPADDSATIQAHGIGEPRSENRDRTDSTQAAIKKEPWDGFSNVDTSEIDEVNMTGELSHNAVFPETTVDRLQPTGRMLLTISSYCYCMMWRVAFPAEFEDCRTFEHVAGRVQSRPREQMLMRWEEMMEQYGLPMEGELNGSDGAGEYSMEE